MLTFIFSRDTYVLCVCLAMEEAANSECKMLNEVCFVLGKDYQGCIEIRFNSGFNRVACVILNLMYFLPASY